MNSLNTLYFPGTDIYSISQYPIFLLFQKIHLIKSVEVNTADSDDESTDSFIKSGFCQVHTPCPLGENRNRFLHLVDDIRNRKDDYAAQLSTLILAGKTGLSAVDEDSERAILNSLRTPIDQQAKSLQVAKTDKLWQARLVLSIGEILDREEEEIARNLASLEDDQADLFKELHGDDEVSEEDNPFAELRQVTGNLNAAGSGNMKNRFNAWKTLFLEGDIQECEIFLTTSRDGGELLLESYEKRTNHPAPLISSLELPGLIGWNSDEASQSAAIFYENNKELLSRLHETLADFSQVTDFTEQGAKINTTFAAMTEEWKTQLEIAFPAKHFGRIPVKCYLLEGIACSVLVGKEQSKISSPKNGLLVVVG